MTRVLPCTAGNTLIQQSMASGMIKKGGWDHEIDSFLHSVASVKRLQKNWPSQHMSAKAYHWYDLPCSCSYLEEIPKLQNENIQKKLRLSYEIKVSQWVALFPCVTLYNIWQSFQWSRIVISSLLHMIEPEAVQAHHCCHFKWKCFWAAGVNDIWCQDQHNKWLHFSLWFYNSIDLFTGFTNWLNIWWTNKNLQLITGYYFKAVHQLRGV